VKNGTAPADEALMTAYVAGDERAFEELFRRHAGPILGLMRRGWVDRATAEDLVQQTFLQLHRARHDFRAGGAFRAWLFTIARNVRRDHLRRVLRREPTLDLEGREPGRSDEGPARYAAREALGHALDRLPVTLRRVLELHYFEHLSFADVAASLGISRSAAKVRAHRAYRALRELLEPPEEVQEAGCDRGPAGGVSEGGEP